MGQTPPMRHPKLFERANSVLVVVDIQAPFLQPVVSKETIVERSRFLIRCARILDIPILATLQYATKMGGMIPEIAEVLPESCVPADKLCFSSFGAAAFARSLQETGRRQVVMCGIETHICICQTVLDLIHAGYTVGVPFDAVSGRSAAAHEAALRRLDNAGAVIASAEGVVYEWLYQSGTPEFKQVLEIVKAR